MRTKNEIKTKIIEIATKMDEARTLRELASYYILDDKKRLLEWVLNE